MKLNSKTASFVRRTARMVPTAAVLMSLVFVAACARTVKKSVRPSEQTVQLGAAKVIRGTFGNVDFYSADSMKLASKFEGATVDFKTAETDADGRSVDFKLTIVMKDLDGKPLIASGVVSNKVISNMTLESDATSKYAVSAKCYDASCQNVAVQLTENEIKVQTPETTPEMLPAIPAENASASENAQVAETAPAASTEVTAEVTAVAATETVMTEIKPVASMYLWLKTPQLDDDSKKVETEVEAKARQESLVLYWSNPTVVGGTSGSMSSAEKALNPADSSDSDSSSAATLQTEVMDPATPLPALQPLNVSVPALTPVTDDEATAAETAAPTVTATAETAAPAASPAPTATPALF